MKYNVLYQSYDFLKTCTLALIINSPVKGLRCLREWLSAYFEGEIDTLVACFEPQLHCLCSLLRGIHHLCTL